MGRAFFLSLLLACVGCGGRVVIDGASQASDTTDTTGAGGAGGASTTNTPTGPCSPPSSPPLPLLWYPLDGDARNAGSLGDGYDGVATDLVWVSGKSGQSAEIGVGWVAFPGTYQVLLSAPALTIALWLQFDFTSYGPPYMACRSLGEGFESYHGVYQNKTVTTCAGHGATGGCGSFDVPDAGWHHVLYRYASTSPGGYAPLEIYLDGNHAVSITTEDGGVLFGKYVDDLALGDEAGDFYEPTHHHVDELRVYDKVFSEEEQCTQIVGGSWCDGECWLP
jgi:hypothetical protein